MTLSDYAKLLVTVGAFLLMFLRTSDGKCAAPSHPQNKTACTYMSPIPLASYIRSYSSGHLHFFSHHAHYLQLALYC